MSEQILTIQTPFLVQSLDICGHLGNLGIKEEFMYGINFLGIIMILKNNIGLYNVFENSV